MQSAAGSSLLTAQSADIGQRPETLKRYPVLRSESWGDGCPMPSAGSRSRLQLCNFCVWQLGSESAESKKIGYGDGNAMACGAGCRVGWVGMPDGRSNKCLKLTIGIKLEVGGGYVKVLCCLC